jgi:ABC-type phosphate transport system substrate-binding protein
MGIKETDEMIHHFKETTMKSMSKLALALVGVAGLALAAETAQAQLVLNGAGSSAGRLFAGDSPADICANLPKPLLFVSSEGTPNKYEWQCTVNGVANSRIRYSATNSSDGYLKQPNGAVGTATYLDVATCPVGSDVTILSKTVSRSVCPSNTPTQILTVHWGGADVKASSIHQSAFGTTITPPASGHLTATPTVIVPFSIVVGGNVRNGLGAPLTSLTQDEIRQIFAGNVLNWTDLGYSVSAGSAAIVTCQRTVGSGTLATLDETMMLTKFWSGGINPLASATNVANASSSNMVTCINTNQNSIGYLDSDSVNATNFPNGAYQVQIGGQPINNGALGTGVARLTALRCGRYPYWADWNFITRNAGVEVAPISAVAGTNAAITALGNSMLAHNPLPDFWLSENDTFVFKNDDRGPHNWFTPSGNGTAIATVCQ